MNKEKKNLVVFGYGLTVILAFWGIRTGIKHEWDYYLPYILVLLAVVFAFITTIKLYLLKPVYTAWMKVATLIGEVVSTVILSLVFFVLFSVTGIVLRILKKDLLDRHIDPLAPSYWVKRKKRDFNKDDYLRQF